MKLKSQTEADQMVKYEDYWLKKLSGDLEKRSFPYDYKATVLAERLIDSLEFTFPGDICSDLMDFIRGSELKLYKMLVAGLIVLLDKYSYEGLKDVILGSPVCRLDLDNDEPIELMSGNSVVALRDKIDDRMSFNELLMQVRHTIITAYENQDYPVEQLLKKLELPASEDDFPLFDIAVCLDSIHEKRDLQNIPVNMIFSFSRVGRSISCVIEYDSSLYESTTIQRIFEHLTKLLEEVLESPGMDLSAIDILSIQEKSILLADFNNTFLEYPKEKTITQMFVEQVEKNPHHIAVSYKDCQVSFGGLDQAANHLAFMLRDKGVGRDSIVGLMTERSVEMMVGIMGIIKSGGAYMPIGITIPQARREFMLEDSQSVLLLTQRHLTENGNFPENTILIEDIISFGNSDSPPIINEAKDIAYVIYTSGTTGKPKGVMVEHWNAVNLTYGLDEIVYKEYGENVRAALLAPYIFDASIQQIICAILLGHALYIVPEDIRVDGGGLIEFYQKYRIEVSDGTPSHLRLMVGASPDEKFDFICYHFMIGGEGLAKTVVEAFLANFKNEPPVVTNVYGPTECCVDSTYFRITHDILPNLKGDIITIGKPMYNEHVYIVNKKLAMQPLGAPGELCIGGDGVSRGYMGREKLTAEKFVPHPVFEDKVLYRTGDITKWMPDGNIAFMDRIDHQVKIRGFRIEIGEIESQILKQNEVRETVVLARDDSDGEKFLCAYIVPEKAAKLDRSLLSKALSESLPSYMVPTHFVPINKIPLTPNGKVDRKALPDPPQQMEKGADYQAPRNQIEQKLVDIWAEVLKMSKDVVSIDDDFFKLGGHSLKAGVMITLIHKSLNVKLKMHEIFDKPSIRQLSQFIGGAEEDKYIAIPRAKKMAYYPQTSMQRRLYFIDQLEDKNTVYNIQMMDIYCKGIDKEKLEEAFKKLIERHESLRTSFHTVEGVAVQKINNADTAAKDFAIEYYETSENGMIYSEQPGKEWTRVTGIPFQDVVEHFVRPFDLTKAPILRVGLVKIYGDTQILMIDMHHIMSDGISMVILINDLWALYEDEFLPPLPVQYKDFAVWHNSEEQMNAHQKMEAFWLQQFSGEISPLNLPTDFPRPPKLSFDGDAVHFEIGQEEAQKINALVREQGSTIYMILLAAYNVLLTKLSGQEEILCGTVTGGRGHADIQNLIGMFVGTLALRNYPKGNKSFKYFLAELKDRTLAAFENQDYPFEKLVSNVAPNHDRNRNPLFDVVFGLENEAEKSEEYLLEVLMLDTSNPYGFNVRKSKFDFMLTAVEAGEGMQFNIEYNIQLYKAETIERFAKYYKKIITSICSDIDQKIAEIDIISKVEKNQIIYEFNDTKVDYPTQKTIQEVFEQHVEITPDNIALKFHDDTLTYREFNEKANQLARVLKGKGVKPENLIGIMSERSFEMMIGIYAIQKAGGAYLPIDPNYPEDRIRYLFKDSGSRLLLTQERFIDFARTVEFDGEVLNLEDDSFYRGEGSNLECTNSPDDMAYVIYTSGSTGKPKGVMIEHVAAVNLLLTLDRAYPIEAEDAYLYKTAFLFDVSVSEIFGWFWRGGKMVILQQGGEKDPLMMIDKIKEENITHLNFVPSMFNVFVSMLDSDNIAKLAGLRYIFLAGEAIWPDSIIKFRSFGTDVIIENIYGPTEATVYSSWYPVAKWQGSGSVSIGKATDNLKLYIISTDEDSKPRLQPVGIAGELTVSGVQLARGYLNRPELTTKMFVDNPFAASEGGDKNFEKLYHTGDLCRWDSEGNVEYMGRIDFQVKVRGFRIELGEIETQLSNIDEVNEGAVIVREDKEGEKYLCAYLVADQELDISSIRETLSKNMPNYMVPSYFMQIEVIPLNPSGKLDRKALPEPVVESSTQEYVAPSNDNEKSLAAVCCEVLGLEKMGIDDDFFEIGGDSIKTILISAKLQKQGIPVNVNDFFSYTTIRQLASQLDSNGSEVKKDTAVRDEAALAKQVTYDYENYIQQLDQEQWPDITIKHDYKHVLVTGATGYLGSYIVGELLNGTSAAVYLPVRGDNNEAAQKRFKERFIFYFGENYYNAHKSRLVVFRAELREDLLGIEKAKYNELSTFVEAVIHSAANVKHFGLYEEFHKDNVEATVKLLDFSLTGKKKSFHFVSTLDTGRGDIDGKDHFLFTEYCSDEGQKTEEVYLKSKQEAERQVLAYRKKGLNTSIYRAANMTFHSETGKFQTNIGDNFFYSMLRAFVKVGFWSQDMVDLEFDLSYVNQAARAIVGLMTSENLKNQIYHICNPYTLSWTEMGDLLREAGERITDMSPEEIKKGLSQYDGNREYEQIIERVKIYAWEWEEKGGTLTVPKMDRTVKLLEEIGFQWSKPGKQGIKRMMDHCKDVNFL
jgi:amino acid adenylation domain-containing protein/thioester reductase-like protein